MGIADVSDPVLEALRAKRAPLVRFANVRGTEITITIVAEHLSLESVQHNGPYAKRLQIPLVLAWGVTVHRVEGPSLDRAVIDLSRCVRAGIVYVALSRIRSMDGVFVKYFAPERARADSVVQAFSAKQGSLADEHADCTSFPESAVL